MSDALLNSQLLTKRPPFGETATVVPPYEQQLSQNVEWALSEGSLFFEERGRVHETLKRITQRLDELGIPYALAGGMALFFHGYRRFTEDVDILVTRESLRKIHKKLEGLGYVRPFAKSKNLRDATSGVRIEFLVTGDYPGDGKPKEISFPVPSADVAGIRNGIRVLNIEQLVSLKLASGMTGEGRTKDLGDVEELIRLLNLPESFSESLHRYVREKFLDLWRKLHITKKRYVLLWRNKRPAAHAQTIDDMIQALDSAAEELKAMRDAGVCLDPKGGAPDDYAHLVTNDRTVAEKFGMEDESEFWDDDDIEPGGGEPDVTP